MKMGFTGTQSGIVEFQKVKVTEYFEQYLPNEFHHGDCIGSDAEAHILFLEYHTRHDTEERRIVIHPPTNPNKRAFCGLHGLQGSEKRIPEELAVKLVECKYPVKIEWHSNKVYLERNKDIVNDCEIMLATPKEVEHTVRSGTWATIRYAWHTKRTIFVIPPLEGETV